MKTLWILSTLLSTSLIPASYHAESFGRPGVQDKTDAVIVRKCDEYLKAVLSHNPAAVAALYRDDAMETVPGKPPLMGRAAIEEHYRGMFQAMKFVSFTFNHLESRIAGDVAYDIGTYKLRLTTPDGTVDDMGEYVVILKRTQGVWKAAYVSHNSDVPPQRAR